MRLRKKGFISIELVMVIIVILVIGFIVITLVRRQAIDTSGVIKSVLSCSSKGGFCISESEMAVCTMRISNLEDCKGTSKPICCITNNPQDAGSIGAVSITGINLPQRLPTSFVAICDVNIEAPGCVYVSVYDKRVSCSSEQWSSYVSSSSGQIQTRVMFNCHVASSTLPGTSVCCVIDTSRCNPQSDNQLSVCGHLG